jgi:ubiquitin carboxyl-terminal hydrolase L5
MYVIHRISLFFPLILTWNITQFENSLRRHNHLGFLHALCLALAKGGKLEPAKEEAKKVMKERIERRKANGEEMDED